MEISTQDAALFFVVTAVLYFGLTAAAKAFWRSSPRRRRYWRRGWRSGNASPASHSATDAGTQLNAVMAGSFERQRVLNPAEFWVFKIIENELAAIGKGYRVLAQTCLGEVLQTEDDPAFHAINSKRVDFLIVDRGCWPVLAIEYQGDGHYLGTAAARDAIKKEALRKAGVNYLEISTNDKEAQIRSRLHEQLGLH